MTVNGVAEWLRPYLDADEASADAIHTLGCRIRRGRPCDCGTPTALATTKGWSTW